MIQPPRITARLLESISAPTDFSRDVLGDLAELFESRARLDDIASARRAYNRDALRAAPFLIRDWARSLKGEALEHYVSTVLATWLITLFTASLVVIGVTHGLDALHVHTPQLPRAWGAWRYVIDWITVALNMFAIAVVAGVIVAWLSERPVLMNAVGLGVLWAGLIVSLAIVGGAPHLWYRCILAAPALIGTTTGAVLRVRLLRFADDRRDGGASSSHGAAVSTS